MEEIKKVAGSKWVIAIGVGLAIYPIHNRWLTELTSINGKPLIHLPQIGAAIIIVGSLLFVANNIKHLRLGDKKIYIPLLIIVTAISISGFVTGETIGDKIAPFGMAGALFGLYLVSTVGGIRIFKPMAIGVVIASIGIIAYKFTAPGRAIGGYVFVYNYDIATGYILLGAALFFHKWRWVIAGLGVIALFLSGSAEAVFAMGVMGAAILFHERRKLFNKKVISIALVLMIIVVIFFSTGYGFQTHKLSIWSLTGDNEYIPDGRRLEGGSPILRRIRTIGNELSEIKPFGVGYILTDFSRVSMVHNVPLVIVQQLGWLGIIAGIAWLWVSIYLLVKTKWRWKYIWILVLSLSVFDHYIWTQLAPWWWAIVGASSIGVLNENDNQKDIQTASA